MVDLATDNISKKITFSEIFDYENIEFVEIPIIQRDYAQGRQSASEVREIFLTSLYDALTAKRESLTHSLNLDFVYGSIDNDIFSILDGQQRLTTLFLLHWYLAIKDNRFDEFVAKFTTNKKSRFTYKTRKSSTEFFNALTLDDSFIDKIKRTTNNQSNNDIPTISEVISDCNWFYLSWKHDPTVQACLNMLDAIDEKFKNYDEDLYLRITNTEDPYITFQFLPLDHFGLSDELYIKMNARGKPLTPFEHFKAILEQASKSQSDSLPELNLDARGGMVSGHEYFTHKIDTDWADLFWTYRKIGENHDTFDDEFMNFIRLIILFEYMGTAEDSSKNIANTISETFFANNNNELKSVAISTYKNYNCLNAQFIGNLIHILNLLDANDNHSIKTFLPTDIQEKYYPEEDMFKKVLADKTTYTEKLRFYAFYYFLMKNLTLTDISTIEINNDLQTKLIEWMRVIYNLTENTITDDTESFNNAFLSIQSLISYDTSILDALAHDTDFKIRTFNQDQVVEEKVKANLILRSNNWREAILDAEAHPFFKGQIGFLLNFSGILEYYREYENSNWSDSEDANYLEAFKRYATSAGALFSLIQNSSKDIDYAWERAVLSKGVYFTKKSNDRYNLLSTRMTKNNIERDHSWKRLLRIGSDYIKNQGSPDIIETRQSYVKAVLDDPTFDTNKVQQSLENISAKALQDENIEYWRKAFIKYPIIFSYCGQGFIFKNDKKCLLFRASQRNHIQYEFYTCVIELMLKQILKNNPNYLRPFEELEYIEVRSTYDYAGLKIANWYFDGHSFDIEIYKEVDNFEIIFSNASNEYPELIVNALKPLGFKSHNEDENQINLYYLCKLGKKTPSAGDLDSVLDKLDEVLEELFVIDEDAN